VAGRVGDAVELALGERRLAPAAGRVETARDPEDAHGALAEDDLDVRVGAGPAALGRVREIAGQVVVEGRDDMGEVARVDGLAPGLAGPDAGVAVVGDPPAQPLDAIRE